jgi:serine/threonine protein kinase
MLLSRRGQFPPWAALRVISEIAEALQKLHALNIIHADVNPSNILIECPNYEAYLIDFGMIQPVGNTGDIMILGTYNYLPPRLRSTLPPQSGSDTSGTISARFRRRAPVGPYVDVYALGVVGLQMLTGNIEVPEPLSTDHVLAVLLARNSGVREVGGAVAESIAKLLVRLLSTGPDKGEITAGEAAAIAKSLILTFPNTVDPCSEKLARIQSETETDLSQLNTVKAALENVFRIAESFADARVAMVRTPQQLIVADQIEAETQLLASLNSAFTQASNQIRASWIVGVGMTLCAFALTIAMIICTIVFGIRTKTPGWSLMFGGASVATVFGTFLWRPFDRVFNATILATQIEMIHIQVLTTFRGTTDLPQRIEICREAVETLGAILSTEVIMPKKNSKSPKRYPRNNQ